MAQAAQIGSTTDHAGGTLQGTGVATVMIEGMRAAVANDLASTIHQCGIKPPPPHLVASPVTGGSATVSIGGRPAARVGDHTGCGATILRGATNVFIGG
jgi:uncharacterized Zn-binding protein involved in type VI secretion